ncbi:hypothetical protein [Amycolatopsis sp. NPDC059657]|uniref:hypothetical protein n=1 Tax=Amycolatopsis sp. NPDC059657 TaxID=3346899 RepID=UPI003671D755
MATPTAREAEDREIRKRISQLAEEGRVISSATPAWVVDATGAEAVLRDSFTKQPLVTVHGKWGPNIVRFFAAMTKTLVAR